ncbi:hypothetical protein [Actinoalloteichus fjordicus]|uniref:hypothetical protein n=1 Tax=Actinoalloteichus fjordicus TaxID=1612552 RepID=UPI00095218E0|nr:hypothetical protein [Actinoalloteichus fjordicus]
MTFVGACGTLRQGGPSVVGAMVEADRAVAYDGTTGRRTWATAPIAPTVAVATARSLADSSAGHHRLDADCVDLETAWVLAGAAVAGCRARALLAITDGNREGAVFESDFGVVTEHLLRVARLALLPHSGSGT